MYGTCPISCRAVDAGRARRRTPVSNRAASRRGTGIEWQLQTVGRLGVRWLAALGPQDR